MWAIIKKLILLIIVITCAGCTGDAGFSTSGSSSTSTTSTTVASITMLTSSPQVGSSGTTPLTVTAIVKDSGNLVSEDIPVVFTSDSGSLQVTQAVTDAAGIATATLTPGGDYTNRTITISATTGDVTSSTTVNVTGTAISISGENTVTIGDTTQLTLVLTDSDGIPIGGKTMSISSALGNTLSAASVDTDANGQVQINVTATVAGTDTITATAQGATTAHTLTISGDQFQITTPSADAEISIGIVQTITARWQISGVAQVGQTINFTSTRGTLSANSAVTNASGDASVTISSTNAGPALITAFVTSGPSTSKAVEFVATTADSIELQANPATIGPNDGSQVNTQQSTITATVRDVNNNLVKNKVIRFSITQDSSGGSLTTATSTTNSQGKATTTYVSSAATTALDGVTIRVEVQDTPAVNTTVSLTVARSELFVILGTGNEIVDFSNTQYNKQYVVLVTDATGNAVEGAEVSIAINPTFYWKGFRTWDAVNSVWAQTFTAGPCANEDLNENGILDAGEDTNSNGRLDPGNVVSAPATVTTGADGSNQFDLIYAKDFGQWVAVKLTAADEVSGTEATYTVPFTLPVIAADLATLTISPPGLVSPYGTGAACSDPN